MLNNNLGLLNVLKQLVKEDYKHPRRVLCWVMILIGIIVIPGSKVLNSHLTDMELFFKFWPIYLPVAAGMIAAVKLYR